MFILPSRRHVAPACKSIRIAAAFGADRNPAEGDVIVRRARAANIGVTARSSAPGLCLLFICQSGRAAARTGSSDGLYPDCRIAADLAVRLRAWVQAASL